MADDACLEWLPQESILFDAAWAIRQTDITLQPRAAKFGWDIVQLGRLATGELWQNDSWCQQPVLRRGGRLIWLEQADLMHYGTTLQTRDDVMNGITDADPGHPGQGHLPRRHPAGDRARFDRLTHHPATRRQSMHPNLRARAFLHRCGHRNSAPFCHSYTRSSGQEESNSLSTPRSLQ